MTVRVTLWYPGGARWELGVEHPGTPPGEAHAVLADQVLDLPDIVAAALSTVGDGRARYVAWRRPHPGAAWHKCRTSRDDLRQMAANLEPIAPRGSSGVPELVFTVATIEHFAGRVMSEDEVEARRREGVADVSPCLCGTMLRGVTRMCIVCGPIATDIHHFWRGDRWVSSAFLLEHLRAVR